MNKERIILEVSKFRGYIPSQLKFDGEKIILFLKEKNTDRSSSMRMHFYNFLSFHDTGFIGTTLSYFDIGTLGYSNLYLARQKGLITEEYCQAVFITEVESQKVELIIACRNIEIVSTDSIQEE